MKTKSRSQSRKVSRQKSLSSKNDSMKDLKQMIECFLTMQMTMKLYHWQTSSYARHKSSDEIFQRLITLVDEFIESYQGRYGKMKNSKETTFLKNINIETHTDKSITKYIKECKEHCQTFAKNHINKNHTEILNIMDEIIAALDQTLYLFEFH
jgi:hypothetical protein